MSSFKELLLKASYDSDTDDILNDFLIPVLSRSILYDRLAGFFTSTSLAVAARGIAGLIKNKGQMRIVASTKLNKEDVEIISEALKERDGISDNNEYLEDLLIRDLELFENEFAYDHVKALGWMVKNNLLEIKIATVIKNDGTPMTANEISSSGIFHQKVGIFRDLQNNIISFSGSVNETGFAWLNENIEEFKVFRSWIDGESSYLNNDVKKFEKYWNGEAKRVIVMDIPSAVEKKLIEYAPNDLAELNLERWNGIYKKFKKKKSGITLWDHQRQAVNNWLATEDPEGRIRGLFQMATGTGKTFAALGCLAELISRKKRLIAVISCPYTHLVKQWIENIEDFSIDLPVIEATGSNPSWKQKVKYELSNFACGAGRGIIIVTTHDTLSKDTGSKKDLQGILRKYADKVFLIADEVHWLGAPKLRQALIEDIPWRLGLSATPRRYFDDDGTSLIFDYFGETVFEFNLIDAILNENPVTGKSFLTPYWYNPQFVELTKEEMGRYVEMTSKIAKAYFREKDPERKKERLTVLYEKRSEIVKNAEAKFSKFSEIIEQLGKNISNCLVYVTPDQLERVQDILNDYGVIQRKFTFKETISEREQILDEFKKGTYQALVAMNCLDEGVDIPPAKTAIIMASTGNPKQYIQRRGRILRRYPGKEEATIYDFIVLPPLDVSYSEELMAIERKILRNELRRYRDFARAAKNCSTALASLYEIEKKYGLVV